MQKSWPVFIALFVFAALAASATSSLPLQSRQVVALTCQAPNATVTGFSSGSVSFSWDGVEGATAYKVYYVRKDDNYTSQEYTTGNTSIAFSELPSGTYDFYFATVCGGQTSSFLILSDLIL